MQAREEHPMHPALKANTGAPNGEASTGSVSPPSSVRASSQRVEQKGTATPAPATRSTNPHHDTQKPQEKLQDNQQQQQQQQQQQSRQAKRPQEPAQGQEQEPATAFEKRRASMPRMFEADDFESQFDSFPDERFHSQPAGPAPTPQQRGVRDHHHHNQQEQQQQQPPQKRGPRRDQGLKEDDLLHIPEFARKDFRAGERQPDVPSQETADYVNNLADWSLVEEGDSCVLDILMEKGLVLKPVNNTPWAEWDKDSHYFGKHADLRPTAVRDSPMQQWSMLNWTNQDWIDKVGYLYTLSISSHRHILYYGRE